MATKKKVRPEDVVLMVVKVPTGFDAFLKDRKTGVVVDSKGGLRVRMINGAVEADASGEFLYDADVKAEAYQMYATFLSGGK